MLRFGTHVVVVVALLASLSLAVGCGSSSRPYTFGGNPNQSPDNNTNPTTPFGSPSSPSAPTSPSAPATPLQ